MNKSTLLSSLALLAVVAAVAGCASANYKKGAGTAAALTESADKITGGEAKIDEALTSLNDLVNNPGGDLVPKFKKFTDAICNLQSTAHDVSKRVADIREKGDAYFKAWDKQLAMIKNEDIKQRSAERKAEVQKSFGDI